jgi:hypothetical protein
MSSLIIEIQSGLVRGVIVKKGSHKPEILARYSIPINSLDKTSAHLTKSMLKAVSEVAKHLTHKHHVESVHVVLSSPWALSHSKAVEMNFDKNTTVNQKMILDIVDEDNNKKKSHQDLTYIEKKIFEVKLNGYVVHNYENKPARKLEVSFATTLGSQELLNKIFISLEKAFKVNIIQYHSGLLLDYISLGTFFANRNDYVYIHAHSELTDIVVVKSSICKNISSFPNGTSSLVEKIPESLLSMINKDAITKTEYNRLSPRLNSYFDEWFAQIKSLIDLQSSPRFIYISTHSFLNIYMKKLTEILGKEYHIHNFEPDTMEMYSIALKDML